MFKLYYKAKDYIFVSDVFKELTFIDSLRFSHHASQFVHLPISLICLCPYNLPHETKQNLKKKKSKIKKKPKQKTNKHEKKEEKSKKERQEKKKKNFLVESVVRLYPSVL